MTQPRYTAIRTARRLTGAGVVAPVGRAARRSSRNLAWLAQAR